LVDDLAVAYTKLGQYEEGIAVLEQALETLPNRYETLANLGALHMLRGDMHKGKVQELSGRFTDADADFVSFGSARTARIEWKRYR